MLRFLLRSAGFVLLAAAFAALIVDGTRSIAARHIVLFEFGETANWLFPAKLAWLKQGFDQGGMLALRPLLTGVLFIPTWMVGGCLGTLLLFAGRRPPPPIGFSSRP